MSVLPALGGETINPRCPLPIGDARSIILEERSSADPLPCSRVRREVGKSGVKFSKRIFFFVFSGASLLIVST